MSKAKKRKPAKQSAARRDSGGNESPEAVLAAIDKFVAARRATVDRLTERAIKAKRPDPEKHRALNEARVELSEALKLRVRVAKVVMDVEQRLRMVENSARFAIATAFAEYQQRTSRG
jgi:hypothetical protein